jgi:hypothetical protein
MRVGIRGAAASPLLLPTTPRHARPSPPSAPPVTLTHVSPLPSPLSAGRLDESSLDDLHSFDPATMTWTLLSAADDAGRPSARANHGFTSAGGLLYVHGGRTQNLVISEGKGVANVGGGWEVARNRWRQSA